ncbi:MAG: MBL fold metallo-hydrolase [Gemmatimonadales bacterium]
MAYTIRFWGTRGSIPTPGPHTSRYGGNTPCISVEGENGNPPNKVILDAGTGIRLLGSELLAKAQGGVEADLLLSHTHWDHIQGLPFFGPFFGSSNRIRIWGPPQGEVGLEKILRLQMDPVVFPVPLDRLAAQLSVEHVESQDVEIDGFRVQTTRLRHPGNTLGYRLTPQNGGASFAYVTDNELGSGGDYQVGPQWRQELVDFLSGAEVLIHDAMYTTDELEKHRGWGHSSNYEAVALAREAGVGRLVLFHHLPEHSDEDIDHLLQEARTTADDPGQPLEVIAATEGLELTL